MTSTPARTFCLALIATLLILPAAACRQGKGGGLSAAFKAGQSGQVASPVQTGWTAPTLTTPSLRVEGGKFYDQFGRLVIPRGVNVADSCKRPPFLPWQDQTQFDTMQAWGMNVLRLLIEWEAIEPQPGKYDYAYLDKVAERVKWAGDRGMYVFLDMHQDRYSNKYFWDGNGAPRWAHIDTFGLQKVIKNVPWGLRSYDPGVLGAWESFWQDKKPMGEAKGIQTHFVDMWTVVAERFKNDPYVIGFDVLNEPWYGYKAYAIATKGLWHVLTKGGFGFKLAVMYVASPSQTMDLIRRDMHENKTLYAYLDSMDKGREEFDRKVLGPFMQRVVNAVRPVAPHWIAFVEPTMDKGAGGNAFLRDLKDSSDRPLKNLCYAPHYYDPTMQWVDPYDGNQERARIAFDRIKAEAKALDAAVLLGEWGGIEAPGNAEMHIKHQLNLIEEYAYGATWWDYRPRLETESWLDEWIRPYPKAIAGELDEFYFDSRRVLMSLRWMEKPGLGSRVTEVFIPDRAHFPNGVNVVSYSDPAGTWTATLDKATYTLKIEADPNTADHVYEISPK